MAADALEVADAVAVRVGERSQVELVDDGVSHQAGVPSTVLA